LLNDISKIGKKATGYRLQATGGMYPENVLIVSQLPSV